MSASLPDHLGLIATAPSGIQKLRGLILELAVRGKLVPQDPNDEPASELLKRISKERERLEAEGICKKSKAVPPVGEDEQAFALPNKWEWVRLGTVSRNVQYGYTASADHASRDVLFVRITDIQDNRVNWDAVPGCQIPVADVSAYQLQRGDILIARTGGTIGKSYLVEGLDRPAIFASYLIRVGYLCGTDATFTKVFLGSECYWSQLYANSMGTGQPNVNGTALSGLTFPLPPLAEQHRIVAKVDELMALCDRLEAEQTDATNAHAKLVETLLGTLTQSRDADELAANWQRLSQHFDTLFNTETSLDALKQTILQLAVMGKLVPQDPNDEPASEFLKRIASQKNRLEQEGKNRGGNTVTPISADYSSESIPLNWVWALFGNIMVSRDSERIPVSKDERNTRAKLFDYYGASGVIDKIDTYLFNKPLLLIGEDGANLINRSTPIAFIACGQYWVNNHAHVLDGISEGFLRFIELYINAIDLKPYVTGTAQPKMNQAKMNSIPIALPPEAEQHRIVAKVDELMALCDRLAVDLAESRTQQARLSTTLIDAALQAA